MLTLNPDIESQSLDRLPSYGLPCNRQHLTDRGLDLGRPIENLVERSAPETMTTTKTDHEKTLVGSRSVMRIGRTMIEGRHTNRPTWTVRMDQIRGSATAIDTNGLGTKGTEHEVDLPTQNLRN